MEDGRILVPKRAESEDGGIIGDGVVPIGPEDPDYEDWDRMLKEIAKLREEDPETAEAILGPSL